MAILIGNGLNRCESFAPSWKNLLNSLTVEDDSKTIKGLPNAFEFEFIEFKAIEQGQYENTHEVKRSIGKAIRKAIPHGKRNLNYPWQKTLHRLYMELPCTTYLTTNYDYALEYSLDPLFKSGHTTYERLYSLKRKQFIKGNEIYHIHGECDRLDSILLGYEQYAGTLEKIRNEIVKSTGSMNVDGETRHTFALNDYLIGLEPMPDDWFYKFFTEDLYIVGFSLDFSEIDIWWLLSYRKRAQVEGKIQLKNRIIYLDTETATNRKKADYKAKMELLKVYGVEIKCCDGRGYPARYKKAADVIRTQIQERNLEN